MGGRDAEPGLPEGGALSFFAGGGEMAALMRAYDWASTPLGPAEHWPQSLKTIVRMMLTSRYAMWMGWGSDLVFFYNDAYRPTLGVKHGRALGSPAARVWAEIWPDIGPLVSDVMQTGTATWSEGLLLFLERSGSPEETYHTFSYSPLADDSGHAAGMLCVVMEETRRVIGERRLATLRELASELGATNREDDVLQTIGRKLAANARDLPFTLTYLFDAEGSTARLACASGIGEGEPAAPRVLAIGSSAAWPTADLARDPVAHRVSDLADRFESLPCGAWDTAPQEAVIVPIRTRGRDAPAGLFIAAVNPYRAFDEDYLAFLKLLADQIGSAIANARAYEQERERAEALAEVDRAKTAFFSNVSHEFRTPLTLMLGPLEESLADASLPARERERVALAHRNGSRLLRLVNSLLDFSRIEAGRARATFAPTDLPALTAELASNFRSATAKAGLALEVDCPPLPEPVYLDRDMWEKVVLNLLSNAFKFTFEGRIAVAVRKEGDRAVLSVSDTGTGISQEELPRMFERFHRIEGARGRSFEGSGIGLALVQELVRQHGGEIRVDSAEGQGSTFTVTIPLGSAHLPADRVRERPADTQHSLVGASFIEEVMSWLPAEAATAAPGGTATDGDVPVRGAPQASGGSRPRVLVADDNADMRSYVHRLLGPLYDCELTADGFDALAAARRRRPDLLLTDIMMPGLDGFGLIRQIREDRDLRDVPIIVLSARAGEEASIEGLSLGADDYLVKPFSARELIARVQGALAVARIRHEVGDALRRSEERFRAMADNAPVMIWTTDSTGYCTYLSRSWYEFTGQTPQTGLGFGWIEATHPDDQARAQDEFLSANARREAFRCEYRLRCADGTYRWALDAAAPWFDANGEFLGYIGSVIDITERKEVEQAQSQLNQVLEQRVFEAIASREATEAQLRQAQKMESVGRITGGVAHDFNNLLQVIGGNLQLLAREVAGNQRAEQRLQSALTGVSRGATLSSHLLAFGRRQPLTPKVLSLGRLLGSMNDLLRRTLGDGVDVETIVARDLGNAFVDAGQLENALLNLAINARDAMQGHGKLTIEAQNAVLDEFYAARHPDVAAGDYVMLAVSDTGCGIAPELINQVFEPFFTTKPEGKGTGLGLSMVYGFVKQSGGHIRLYSEPGLGTTIRIYLSRAMQPEEAAAAEVPAQAVGGTETILVVEDDDEVRATVVAMLDDLGYRVLKARDADSALLIVESGVTIDLLFTDVVMPGKLRSPDLVRLARQRLPGIAVLFTSGYTDNAIVHGGRLDAGVDLLSKPYTREALALKLRQVLRDQPRQLAALLIADADAALPMTASSPAVAATYATPSIRTVPSLPAPAPARSGPAGGADQQTSGRHVLVVDDDRDTVESMSALLEFDGHVVRFAQTGAQALGLVAQQMPDVILLDIGLPGQSGYEVCSRIRSLPQGHRPTIIAFTGWTQDENDPRTREAGFDHYLVKPVDIDRLNRYLRQGPRSGGADA